MIIFNTKNYHKLSQEVALKVNATLGEIERKSFPDGENYLRILSLVKNEDVVVLGGTSSDEETLELFDLCLTLSQSSPKSVKVFILYFGYSTMERSVKEGEVVRGLTRVYLLDSLPKEIEFFTLDIHSMKINNAFKNHNVKNLSSEKEVIKLINSLNVLDLVIASPDQGRNDFILRLAEQLDCESSSIKKNRISAEDVEIKGSVGDVENKNIIIYDDMIRSGATLLKAAQYYKENGAKSISVIATHAIFGGDVLNKLKESELFQFIFVSNSTPHTDHMKSKSFLSQFSVIPIIQQEIEKIL
jgi:ribose-phosphate pyrophosphokinase